MKDTKGNIIPTCEVLFKLDSTKNEDGEWMVNGDHYYPKHRLFAMELLVNQ
ncbi:hypothetical protein ACM55H_17650 [Flavobacterium sp. ZT3R17]